MGRQKKAPEAGLIAALKFVKLCGAEFCSIGQNSVIAFTDHVCMGFPIEEDLTADAHIENLLKSLLRSNEHTTITQLDLHKLHVNTGDLKVYVDCIDKKAQIKPDVPAFAIDSRFTNAIEKLIPIVSSFGNHIAMKTMLFSKQSVFATNKFLLAEYWHGLDLPVCILSKKFLELVLKSKKEVAGFANSNNSVTVYFKDNSWIMGRNIDEKWIDARTILNEELQPKPISVELSKALGAVPQFSSDGLAYCRAGSLQSHPTAENGASYAVLGLPDGPIYGVKDLKFLLLNASEIEFRNNFIYFFGKNLRGVISDRKA